MEKNFKNIIIMGELDHVFMTHFSSPVEASRTLEYTEKSLPASNSVNGATVINCLFVLNEVLEKLLSIKEENNNATKEVFYIAVPRKLYEAIQKDAYKNWIKNNGVAKSGTRLSKEEMVEWKRFVKLYSCLFQDIALRNTSYYEMVHPRYDIDNMKKHKTLIKAMRNRIDKCKENKIESILGML